jgi:hypothetical protein
MSFDDTMTRSNTVAAVSQFAAHTSSLYAALRGDAFDFLGRGQDAAQEDDTLFL